MNTRVSLNQRLRTRIAAGALYQHWQQQSQRERLALSLLAGFLLLTLLYTSLWLPLQSRVQDARQWHQAQSELQQYMLSNQALAQQAGRQTHTTLSLEKIQTLATSTAQQTGLVIQRYDFDASGLRLNLVHVPFSNLLSWLTTLEKQGVRLVELNLNRTSSGQVDAHMTLRAE
jgi:general secretion pathway protein M